MPKLLKPKEMVRNGSLGLITKGVDGFWNRRLDQLPENISQHYPLKFEELDGVFDPGHFVAWRYDTTCFVSKKMKDFIETLEPDIHTFIPVKITLKDGTIRTDYSLLKVGKILNAVVPELSDISPLTIVDRQTGEDIFVRYSYSIVAKITFKRSVVKNSMLWLDSDLATSDIFCSDEFIDLAIDAGVDDGVQKRGNIFFDDEDSS